MLLIITTLVTNFLVMLISMTLNDLKPEKKALEIFLAIIFGSGAHFKCKLRRNY